MTVKNEPNTTSFNAVRAGFVNNLLAKRNAPYHLTEEILGEGTFSNVHKGIDIRSGSPVAAKINKTKDATFADKILREGRIWDYINSSAPHRVRHFLHKRDHYPLQTGPHARSVIFSDLANPSLRELYNSGKKLTLTEIGKVGKQLFEALSDLKAKRIVHGDIKDDNMSFDLESQQLLLMDPGIAQIEKEKMREIIQATRFRAPEIFLGQKKYDANVDVWSLGCLLFFLYTEQDIFPNEYNVPLVQIFSKIGLPSQSYLSQLPQTNRYFNIEDGQYVLKYGLPVTSSWKEIIEETRQNRNDPPEVTAQLIDLLDKIFQYENRISFQEAAHHPFFQNDISFKIALDKPSLRTKDLLIFSRAEYLDAVRQNRPPDCVRIPLSLASLDCVHIPKSQNNEYIVTVVGKTYKTIPLDLQDWPVVINPGDTFTPQYNDPTDPFLFPPISPRASSSSADIGANRSSNVSSDSPPILPLPKSQLIGFLPPLPNGNLPLPLPLPFPPKEESMPPLDPPSDSL